MTRKRKWNTFPGMAGIIAIIGFAAIACDNDDTTPNPCANGHTAGAAETCVTPQTCTTCGAVMQAATGHDFDHDDWVEDAIAATCTDPSYDTRDCKNAPCTVKNKRTGKHRTLGHDLPDAYPATCMEDGFTGTGHCDRCGEDEAGKPILLEPDYHDFSGTPVITPATCTEDGEEIVNCGNNGCTAEHKTELEALGHESTIQPFAATCTTAGNSALSGNCVRYAQCGHVETGTVLAALGHFAWDWTTYNSTNGHLSCTRDNCSGGLAAIGDTGPAGGIIFYVADGEDGRHDGITIQGYTGATGSFAQYTAYYLEAAPANESGTSRWQASTSANNTLIDGITTWANVTAKDTGLAGSIGVGRKDTQTIVNSAAFAALTNTAAQRCASKNFGGKTDWFLPSLGELKEFYKLKGQAGVPQTGIPTTGYVWSSSQSNNSTAWVQEFGYGGQTNDYKSLDNNVRAIRAF